MPQDGQRSVAYRSFFSCDDPKGVAECNKASRKSKTESEKKKKHKNLSRSLSSNSGDDHSHSPSTYQLLQISREAQKLNQVIDTWAKENSSKDIAKDLLKRVLDLKESLAMLGKLQDASQVMAKLRKKHKEKGAKIDGAGIERTTSDRFGYASHRNLEFENPRLSVDGFGSSRDCYDELRDVIKESFARQNLLPKPKLDFLVVPSSPNLLLSSSKKEKGCSYSDRIKILKEEKAKSDFLQDLPSTSSSQSSHVFSYEFDSSDSCVSKSLEVKSKAPNVIAKLMGLEDISPGRLKSYPQKHFGKAITVDLDLPKPRKPPFAVHKPVDSRPRTLEALTETIQFRGLMSSKFPVSDWREGFASDDAPPIVIMKPLYVYDLMEEAFLSPKDGDLDRQKMLRAKKMKDGIPRTSSNNGEGAPRKGEKSPGKRPVQEGGGKDSGDRVGRKASAPVKPKIQKQEVTEKPVPRIQKGAPNARKKIEVETEKSRNACKSPQPRKSEREQNSPKTRVCQERSADSHNSSISKKHVKRGKQVSEPSSTLIGSKIKGDDIPGEPMVGIAQDVNPKLITQSLQLPYDKENDTSGMLDECKKITCYIVDSCESHLPESKAKISDDPYEEIGTDKKKYERSSIMRDILSGSTAFLDLAEELFDIHSCQPTYSRRTTWNNYGTLENKLLFDCAKELLESRSLQCAAAVQPIQNVFVKGPKIHISLEQLMQEVCDGIEYLKSYNKLADQGLVVHKLQTVLQKDMWGKEAANGTWDLGWTKGFTRDEIDQVASDIEQKILSGVIEDVLRQLVQDSVSVYNTTN